ncbi:MAG: N-acetylmuramoyl-L-alanine amidase [Pseudomonadota bacterium]
MGTRFFSSAVCVGLAGAVAQAAGAAVSLQSIALESPSDTGTRVVLTMSGAAEQKVFTLNNPQRLVIDLPATRLPSDVRLPAPAGPVKSLRSGSQPRQTLRLVLELTRPLSSKVSTVVATNGGRQLVIELGSVAPAAPAAPTPVRAAHAPAETDRDVIIAVDAGHGGQDPGASGSNTKEKDVVLAIARALAKRIDAEPGMHAVLTRSDDRFIALRDRINLARAARADLFVSVHADSIRNRDVSGSSVYVLSDRGASSEAARWLAENENAADLKGGVSLGDKGDQLASVLMDLSQTASIGASMEAAERVLAQLDRVGEVRKSQVQQARFVVLKSPDIPSMLVETAYISNPAEEKKLRNPAHQGEIAEAIFKGVRDFLRSSPPDGSLFARQQKSRGATTPIIAGSATQ